MKRTRAQLKAQARQALVGNYGIAIGAMLLVWVIYIVLFIPLYLVSLFAGFTVDFTGAYIGFTIIWYVLFYIFTLLFSIGILRVAYQICMTGTASVGDLFYAFRNHPMRFVGLLLLLMLLQLLAYIPGFVISVIGQSFNISIGPFWSFCSVLVNLLFIFFVSLQYTLAPFVLIDHPDYRVMESLRTSKELMKGNRWRCVVLVLSFIGVLLLGYLSMGVGFLWLLPYLQCTLMFFYLDLKEEHNPPVQVIPDAWGFDMEQEPIPTSETNLWS